MVSSSVSGIHVWKFQDALLEIGEFVGGGGVVVVNSIETISHHHQELRYSPFQLNCSQELLANHPRAPSAIVVVQLITPPR